QPAPVREFRPANISDPVTGLLHFLITRCAANNRHAMSTACEFFTQAVPNSLHRSARRRRHGKKRPANNGDPHGSHLAAGLGTGFASDSQPLAWAGISRSLAMELNSYQANSRQIQ